jgi:hypothetical protein
MSFSRSPSFWIHRKLADFEVDRHGGIASQTLRKNESLDKDEVSDMSWWRARSKCASVGQSATCMEFRILLFSRVRICIKDMAGTVHELKVWVK